MWKQLGLKRLIKKFVTLFGFLIHKLLAVLIMDIDDNLLSETSPLNTQLYISNILG